MENLDIYNYEVITENDYGAATVVINEEDAGLFIADEIKLNLNLIAHDLVIRYDRNKHRINFKGFGIDLYNTLVLCPKIFLIWKNHGKWLIKPIEVDHEQRRKKQ